MVHQQTDLLNEIMAEAFERGATDIYLLPGEPVAYRIDGELVRSTEEPMSSGAIKELAIAAVGEEDIEKLGRTRPGIIRSGCSIPGVADGRLTIAKSLGQCTISIRLFPSTIPSPEEIRLPETIVELSAQSSGLIVFGGDTGSGKTTAALSLLDHINAERAVHICTVEAPVVARLTPKRAVVQQREVGMDVPDGSTGVLAAMTQGADIIYVAELRTADDVMAALTAADAGHLVITTVHGSPPQMVVENMRQAFPEDEWASVSALLARNLLTVTSQLLLERKDGQGRIAVYDLFVPDEQIRNMIEHGANFHRPRNPDPAVYRDAKEDIAHLLEQDLITEDVAKAGRGRLYAAYRAYAHKD